MHRSGVNLYNHQRLFRSRSIAQLLQIDSMYRLALISVWMNEADSAPILPLTSTPRSSIFVASNGRTSNSAAVEVTLSLLLIDQLKSVPANVAAEQTNIFVAWYPTFMLSVSCLEMLLWVLSLHAGHETCSTSAPLTMNFPPIRYKTCHLLAQPKNDGQITDLADVTRTVDCCLPGRPRCRLFDYGPLTSFSLRRNLQRPMLSARRARRIRSRGPKWHALRHQWQ